MEHQIPHSSQPSQNQQQGEQLHGQEGPSISTTGQQHQQQEPHKMEQEFVNLGYEAWLETRKQWTHKPSNAPTQMQRRGYWGVTPEMLVSYEPLPERVSLREVVEMFVEMWEDEDLWD